MRNVVQVVRPALTVLLTEDVARTAGCRLRAAASGRLGEWAGWSGAATGTVTGAAWRRRNDGGRPWYGPIPGRRCGTGEMRKRLCETAVGETDGGERRRTLALRFQLVKISWSSARPFRDGIRVIRAPVFRAQVAIEWNPRKA